MSEWQELVGMVSGMKVTASMVVQRHAAIYAKDVEIEDVNAICNALGDISIDEAIAALDRMQLETGIPARE